VWAASDEADFLKGRFLWAVWDAEELIKQQDEIARKDNLRIGLIE
jgi:hypothetical protein